MHRNKTAVVLALSGLLVAGLAACSSDSSSGSSTTPSVGSSAMMTGSATDVAFAQSMIPHHQQAVEMADLALAPQADASPQVRQLAEQIKAAQDPEIQQMTGWLQGWGAPTAMPGASSAPGMQGMDHSGHDMGGMSVSGMMTDEQMQALREASGQEFDDMWLQMMIEHHQGAIAMAEQVKSSAGDAQVAALADQIINSQQQEIATMQESLATGGQ
jgi:uncharacterized protein (DUF305 family)